MSKKKKKKEKKKRKRFFKGKRTQSDKRLYYKNINVR